VMLFGKSPQCLVVTGLVLAGLMFSSCKSKAVSPPMGPVEVGTVTVTPERLVLTTELPGRTAAYLTAEIRPQVNGLIQSRKFQEGSYVKAGDLLYQIDPAPYEAAHSQAKAGLATAEAELATAEADLVTAEANLPALRSRAERYQGLLAIHAVGQQDYDDASAALRQAEAMIGSRKTTIGSRKTTIESARSAMESARINLGYTPIKAPISGRIGKSNITVGALATAYQATPLAMIQQLDPIYVDVAQANAELLRLRRNLESGRLQRDGSRQSQVKLLLEDGTTYPLKGTLQFRDVTVDPTTGSMTLRLVFANPKEVLLPGMFVRAVVEEGVREQALLVPQQGISRDPKGNPIALVVSTDQKVERRAVELERAIGNRWLVTKGLGAGDRLIVEGAAKVHPGDPVRAAPFTGGFGDGAKPADGKPVSQIKRKGGSDV
jgi:membrane fusion protein, multidrug efflux system